MSDRTGSTCCAEDWKQAPHGVPENAVYYTIGMAAVLTSLKSCSKGLSVVGSASRLMASICRLQGCTMARELMPECTDASFCQDGTDLFAGCTASHLLFTP